MNDLVSAVRKRVMESASYGQTHVVLPADQVLSILDAASDAQDKCECGTPLDRDGECPRGFIETRSERNA